MYFVFLLEISFDMLFALASSCFVLQCLQKLFFHLFFKKPAYPAIKNSLLLLFASVACLFLFPAGLLKFYFNAILTKFPALKSFPFGFFYPAIVLIWFSVACFFLLRQFVGWFSLQKTIKKAATQIQDPALAHSCAFFQNSIPPKVFELATVHSPGLFGWRKPIIVVPAGFIQNFTEQQRTMLYLHELSHLHRLNYPLYCVLNLLDAFFWLHLPLKQEFLRMRQSCELACDQQAIALSQQPPFAYAELLLSAFRRNNQIPTSFGTNGYQEAKLRMENIFSPRKKHFLPLLISAGLLLSIFYGCGISKAQPPAFASIRIEYTNSEIETVPILLAPSSSLDASISNHLSTIPQWKLDKIRKISVAETSFCWEGVFGDYTVIHAQNFTGSIASFCSSS